MDPKSNKSQKMFLISANVLVLELSKGHLKWKITDLVRKTGVSRSLIYHYFGSNKEKMLKDSLNIFVERFYGFELNNKRTTLPEMVLRARLYILEYPEAALLYEKVRMGNSRLTEDFKNIEKRFRKKLIKNFPQLDDDGILAIHTFIHGMVTAPFLTAAESAKVCELLLKSNFIPKN